MKIDLLNKLLKFVDHERGKVIGMIIAVALVLGVWGCEIKLTSPLSGNKITREQFAVEVKAAKVQYETKMEMLNAEMQQFLSNAEITDKEFARWEEFKQGAFDLLAGIVTTAAGGGKINTSQVIASLIGLGGVSMAAGGWYDSNRKNKIIEKEKNKAS